jgi:hypothetical protein
VSALTPDERRDVVVHQFKAIDALTGDPVGERWSVWLGRDNEGSFDTEAEALAGAPPRGHRPHHVCPVNRELSAHR